MIQSNKNDTVCAIATGNAAGAIAIIRLSGSESIAICEKVFSKELKNAESHTAHFGLIKKENGDIVDEVLLTVFKENKSFTGEESVEISCHASSYIQQEILNLLTQNGCRMADAGEFTMRAYLNGKMDLSQAEAVADLIASQNKIAHEISLNQLRGGFSNELKDLRDKLIHFASLVELELDFAEEDVEFADRRELLELVTNVNAYVHKLIDSFSLGNAIKNGVPIAFVGRPNAGKSTVLNALLNEERAIVSDIPGTTRDTVEEVIQYEGLSFRLIDTAGIRLSQDQIEMQGIERSIQKIKQARLAVFLIDGQNFDVEEVLNDLQLHLTASNYILVATKKDIISTEQISNLDTLRKATEKDIPLLAIKDEQDRKQLLDLIYRESIGNELEQYSTIVSNARHIDNLKKASISLEKAKSGLETNITADFVAMDIRQAMYEIGQITGDISTDDLLGNIFAKFCIGK
ncbi:MAG: tRNA modification GTPase [Lentimonas sp.]|jgi:tRNA modification GTPase